ncbi:AAA family ATPase [Methylophaga thiooxydans]|uniref:Putative ATPase, AAA family n=1 Tax=Methylophaga thiooxydans DMS010 TaxID=637616 RepID=C0N3W1_9GAMM|nr:MoxR family ATPase [Methylophaga thiooxydans]EEF80585.1 putative ATPase, AAA family [Methylophaga thiooxydans DMS010]
MPQTQLSAILASINDIILGKNHPIKLALTCLLAKGHLLIEDLPGVGKTTLAHTLASALGLSFQRIQFTSDMLPADIIGVSVYERDSNRFNFHPGPIFTQLILADEVNRASPRTQSALLEAMEEQQVTVEGETYNLSSPFFVVATQNPMNQIGTFPLPESQLDRFLMRIELGYPDAKAERALLLGEDRRSLLQKLEAVISADQLEALQQAAAQVHVSTALVDYVQRILTHTRDSGHYHTGLSPRAGLGLIHAARAWALIENRDHVLPEDIQAVLPSIVAHRLQRRDDDNAKDWVEQLIHQVPIP